MTKQQRGFTLIELMIATAITGILAATAYPSFQGPIFKARRIDGMTALLQLQMSEERWRSEHNSYATLAELKLNPASSMGYYQLSVSEPTATGYAAIATATGAQAGDKACKLLQIAVTGGNTSFVSGTDDQSTNTSANNKRCWNQ